MGRSVNLRPLLNKQEPSSPGRMGYGRQGINAAARSQIMRTSVFKLNTEY